MVHHTASNCAMRIAATAEGCQAVCDVGTSGNVTRPARRKYLAREVGG